MVLFNDETKGAHRHQGVQGRTIHPSFLHHTDHGPLTE